MNKYIDSEKLIAKIYKMREDALLDLDIDKANNLIDIVSLIESFQQEQPMPNSTELIAKWEEEKDVLKQMDFRGDEWRLAQNAFMDGVGIGLSVKQQPSRKEHNGSWIEETKKELQHEEELLDMRLETLKRIREKKNQFQQEHPLTIEQVVEQCKKFGGNPKVIQHEEKCVFGNIPGEDICSVCSAYCSLRVPKIKVSTSTEITAPSEQAEELTFEEYLRGVFEINNGIENDPDNLVRIHAPELLKLARKQEQSDVDLEEEIHRFFEECIEVYDVPLYGKVKERVIAVDCYEIIAYHFYKLGQRTKYQQDRAEFAKLKAKEWQSGYDEGYAKGLNTRKEK